MMTLSPKQNKKRTSGAFWRTKGHQDSAPLPVNWGIPSCILSDLFLPLILVPVPPVAETRGDRGDYCNIDLI